MHRPRVFTQPWFNTVALWGAPTLIKSVQRGTISITGAASATATITSVDTNNAVLRHLGSTYSASSIDQSKSKARLALTNATTITATVNTSPGADTCAVVYEITEYYPGVIRSVQRGTISGAASATITAVDTSRSELVFLGFTTAITTGDQIYSVRHALVNATTVTQTEGAAQTNVGSYQVVEWW